MNDIITSTKFVNSCASYVLSSYVRLFQVLTCFVKLCQAEGSLGSQRLSKVDKWSHREAIGSNMESQGAIGSYREPMGAK